MSEIIERFEREFPQHKEAAQKLRQSGQGSYLLDTLLQLIVDFRADCERLEKEKDKAYTLGLAEGRAEAQAVKKEYFDAGRKAHWYYEFDGWYYDDLEHYEAVKSGSGTRNLSTKERVELYEAEEKIRDETDKLTPPQTEGE